MSSSFFTLATISNSGMSRFIGMLAPKHVHPLLLDVELLVQVAGAPEGQLAQQQRRRHTSGSFGSKASPLYAMSMIGSVFPG